MKPLVRQGTWPHKKNYESYIIGSGSTYLLKDLAQKIDVTSHLSLSQLYLSLLSISYCVKAHVKPHADLITCSIESTPYDA